VNQPAASTRTPGQLVELLADPHRYFAAYRALMAYGHQASAAAVTGLRHPSPLVRRHCCMLLDHFMDRAAIPALTAVLADPDEQVRTAALHALACDRCKGDSCRPTAGEVLPAALSLLASDPSPRVRTGAAEVAGAWVHQQPAAVTALRQAAETDPAPTVRKKAAWFLPGGPIYRRTAPRPARKSSSGAG
jgi:HEAT repeat protein